MNTLIHFSRLARFDKPIGILLLLWPTMSALWLASNGVPDPNILITFIVGVAVMRSAGCVINDLADSSIDKHVERTKQRPLASGALSKSKAVIFLSFLLVIALFLAISLGEKVVLWSFGGLALTLVYPFCKRFIASPQVVLGMAFSWSIPMAYVACGTRFDMAFFLLWAGVAIWIVVYDTFYALVDIDDDIRTGVFSTAILFGNQVSLVTSILQLASIALWACLGAALQVGGLFTLVLFLISMLFFRQQCLIFKRERAGCFKAFNESWQVGLLLFIGIFISLP
ncbi:MAG: 4-hydroxybenzoate octaprenyltransferase [Gammaproteobacteria bacterium]|nr:4-hydroxybenzoate octaprenyltransferase [Gammaproteobacteria bacterium]